MKRYRYKDTKYFVDRSGKVYRNGREVKGHIVNGRVIIKLGKNGKSIFRAKMIAETFLCYEDGMEVHHKNRIRDDDRVCNLVVCSPLQHFRLHNHSLITLKFDENWNLVNVYDKKSEAEKELGRTRGAIEKALARDGRLMYGFHWFFLENLPERFIFVPSESVADARDELAKYIENQLFSSSAGPGFEYLRVYEKRTAFKITLSTLLQGIHFS